MTGLDKVRACMVRALGEAGIKAVEAFPAEGRKKLRGPVAVVSVRSCESGPGSFRDYLGERYDRETGGWQELYGQRMKIAFGLDLYAPNEGGAAGCQVAFDALVSALSGGEAAGLKIKELSRGEVRFDQGAGLLHCPVKAVCEAYLYVVAEADGDFLDFEIKGERT